MVIPTLAYVDHRLFIQQSDSSSSGQILRFPYLDLSIRSHVHPIFVIGNIGWQLSLPHNQPQLRHFSNQIHVSGRSASPPDSADHRWIPRLVRLLKCLEIYGTWAKVNEGSEEVRKWKRESRGASVSSVAPTAEGHYQTRSSRSRPMSHGDP